MRDVMLVASLGALGAVSRYWLSGWALRHLGDGFAWGTLAVNLVGCLVLGGFMHLATERASWPPEVRTALAIGFLGAFTTFSTFGYETFYYLQDKRWLLAAANIAANVVLGLVSVWAGVSLARLTYGP